jgi:hypothetical protein
MSETPPAPHELSPRGWEIASAYYASGYIAGIDHGRQQLEDEWRGRQEVSAAIARMVAEAGPWDELEDRRGRPASAAAHRRLMAERGVSP